MHSETQPFMFFFLFLRGRFYTISILQIWQWQRYLYMASNGEARDQIKAKNKS